MTLSPVLRAEVMPRRIPRTAAPIQMMVLVEMVQGLLNQRGRRGPLILALESTDADVPTLFAFFTSSCSTLYIIRQFYLL